MAIPIGETVLVAGELLLAQGSDSRIEALRGQWNLMVLDSKVVLPRTALAPWGTRHHGHGGYGCGCQELADLHRVVAGHDCNAVE